MAKETLVGALVLPFIVAWKRESSSSAKIRSKRMECSAVAAIGRRLHWPVKRSFGDRVFGHWALEIRSAQAQFCRDEELARASMIWSRQAVDWMRRLD